MSLKLTNLAKNAVINAVILNSDTFLLQWHQWLFYLFIILLTKFKKHIIHN